MSRALGVIWLVGIICWGIQLDTSWAQEFPTYSTDYDPARDPFSDGREALQLARETGRRVLIEVGGDWCSWCHAVDRFLNRHPAISKKLHERFVVLKVNVDENNDNAEFLDAFPPAMGYPHMYVTANDGSILHSQDTADFLNNGKYSEQRILDFLNRWSQEDE